MATPEHCVLCFEALEAHLQGRKSMSLDAVQTSWAAYSSSGAASGLAVLRDPALRRVAGTSPAAAAAAAASSGASSSSSSSVASPALASTPATSTSSLPLDPPTSAPLFVTWNTLVSNDDDDDDDDDGDGSQETALRGCIGTFESQPLSRGIPDYAVTSAVHDSRFAPVEAEELPELQVAVTLLTDFEEARDARDWEVGVHGIRLSFVDRGRRFGSTYLPDVAAEQGWTKDEALFSLTRKAGWVGSRARWRELDLRVTRYQGKKCRMDYAEYKRWRDWKEGHDRK